MSFVRGLRSLVPVSVVVVLGACGGAALESGAETTAAPAPREPLADLEALQRDFDESEARLSEQLERQPPAALQRKEAAPKAAAPPRDAEGAATDGAQNDAVSSACDLVCRALSSMKRCADGICSLTGEPHERCAGARGRVEAAGTKAAAAGCPCRL